MQMGIYDLKTNTVLAEFKGDPYKITIERALTLSGAESTGDTATLNGKTFAVCDIVPIILQY